MSRLRTAVSISAHGRVSGHVDRARELLKLNIATQPAAMMTNGLLLCAVTGIYLTEFRHAPHARRIVATILYVDSHPSRTPWFADCRAPGREEQDDMPYIWTPCRASSMHLTWLSHAAIAAFPPPSRRTTPDSR